MQQTISGNITVNLIGTLRISCYLSNFSWKNTSYVKILLRRYNLQVTKALSSLVDTSEAIRLLSKNKNSDNLNWCQWLAGLIDGDGCFLLSKKGYASLEITMDIRDEHALQIIKNRYGGSIKLRSNAKALRYRLHHKSGLLALIFDVNGLIRNSNRLVQLNKLCDKYELTLIYPEKLDYNNGWLSGFFDACGLLTYKLNNKSQIPMLSVSVTHRSYDLLVLFKEIFGGKMLLDKGLSDRHTWCLESEDGLIIFCEYFKKYTLHSAKRNKFFLVTEFYNVVDLKAFSAPKDSILGKAWSNFDNKFKRSIHTSSIKNQTLTNLSDNKK